ncbi:winged helix-turn-helix transcriptional regulator [Anditalea andensis]|uniref:Transcriptional regulator n=1 Tax=Anditalea andensis TaxID=1048983 RepID=A0A074L082_9BACT|nr:winged helix-turn-helix transcriptional regulator [Anditalea andensis]KEO75616.1 transcriptional regulator [Anditalea andensis]
MSNTKVTSTNFANKKVLSNECSEVYTANIIGGQWSLPICYSLLNGKLRFGELKKLLPNITERMLTLQLRKLEKNKVLTRKIYAEVPPRVEYELTAIGYELKPIIIELEKWGEKHKELK